MASPFAYGGPAASRGSECADDRQGLSSGDGLFEEQPKLTTTADASVAGGSRLRPGRTRGRQASRLEVNGNNVPDEDDGAVDAKSSRLRLRLPARVGQQSSGSPAAADGNNSSSKQSYSKIFRQYLPSSFNLIRARDHITVVNENKSNSNAKEESQQQWQQQLLLQQRVNGHGDKFNNKNNKRNIKTCKGDNNNGKKASEYFGRSAIGEPDANEKSHHRFGKQNHYLHQQQQQELQPSQSATFNRLTGGNFASGRQLPVAKSIANALSRLKITTASSATGSCKGDLNNHISASTSSGSNKPTSAPPKSLAGQKWMSDLNNNSLVNFLNNSHANYTDDFEHRAHLIAADDEDDDSDENQNELEGANKIRRRVESFQASSKITSDQKMASSSKRQAADKAPLFIAGGLLILLAVLSLTGDTCLALQQSQVPQTSSVPLPFRSQGNQNSNLQGQAPPQSPLVSNSGAGVAPGAGSRGNPQPAAGSLVANINCNKIRGHVTLTPNLQGGTTVTTQISSGPPGEVYQWSIHQFPVKPGAAMCSCSALILGSKLIDLSEMHGNLPSDQGFSVQSSLSLFGFDSPVGHSLMLRGMKTGVVACATFLPTSRKSNYRAKFHTPLSGSVTIFQTAFGTSFISHLMYSNGTRRHSQHRFDLVKSEDEIVANPLLSGAQATPSASPGRGESLAKLEQREHEHELAQCRQFANLGEALLRNMTYQLSVSTENFGMRGRTAMVLPQIPFETFSSVFVVVYSEHDPNEPIACAPLRFAKPKTAAAKFQSVSVQGTVIFSQDSPYDATVASVNLNMPNSDAHSYGIDELPMIIRRKSDTRVCPNIREIIYNPHHVEPSSVPPEGEATSDQYAVGDLSGKYGSLTGKAAEKIQVSDFNLPLFGPTSIVGRAMTIYSAEGVAIACSNVELTTPMTTAFATFDFGIQGQFIFRQPLNDCNGDTYVYIEVSKPTVAGASNSVSSSATAATQADQLRTLDHNWHIHTNPVDSGLDHLSTTDCSPAGSHFNPYNTSTASIYNRDCTPFNVLRCELGDLSSKMFTIEIPPYRVKGGQEPDIGKFFGTDIDLPLCGPVSVVNRSVVVHVQDFGSQRLACSTVIEFKPRVS